jgi:hypothetical protein
MCRCLFVTYRYITLLVTIEPGLLVVDAKRRCPSFDFPTGENTSKTNKNPEEH